MRIYGSGAAVLRSLPPYGSAVWPRRAFVAAVMRCAASSPRPLLSSAILCYAIASPSAAFYLAAPVLLNALGVACKAMAAGAAATPGLPIFLIAAMNAAYASGAAADEVAVPRLFPSGEASHTASNTPIFESSPSPNASYALAELDAIAVAGRGKANAPFDAV